jgi:putative peptide zinc metalloprotease protein
MNIVEALNVALPEIPQRRQQKRPPKMNPGLVAREHLMEGTPVVRVLVPETHSFYNLPPDLWKLLQLFDGERDYEEIAALYRERYGIAATPEWVRDFATENAEGALWQRSLQEKNARYRDELAAKHRAHTQKKSNLAEITFPAWDPDRALTWIHDRIPFIFTYQFLLVSLGMFGFASYIAISRWSEIGRDNLEFYNFTDKSAADIFWFWILVCLISVVHEFCHGLACKHTGGESHSMGFLLIYLSPAFYCDTTEAWVYGGKWQIIATAAAGVWSSLIIYSLASFLWWGTASNSVVHSAAYMTMLASGILPVVINLNPLIKLDGYYIFTELLDISDLKENSTSYVMGWVKKNIFRLPVEVPYVRWQRRLLYVPYTLASGVYSYGLLFFVVTFVYNIFHRYTEQWAFVPATLLALLIFKSRILASLRFMKLFYLDKRDLVKVWFTPARYAALACAGLVIFFAPVWRESIEGRFLLEPGKHTVVRVEVPGTLAEIYAEEGQAVSAGTPLLRLRNLDLESESAKVKADLRSAEGHAVEAQLRYADYATAERHRQELAEADREIRGQMSRLTVLSPMTGTIVSPRVKDLQGSYLLPGSEVLQIADLSLLQARIYIPEPDVGKIRLGAPVSLRPDALTTSILGDVTFVATSSTQLEAGLLPPDAYKGIQGSRYYVVRVPVDNGERLLRDGMTGSAKILVRHQSLARFTWQSVTEFIRRKLW